MTVFSTLPHTAQYSRLFEKAERYFNMIKSDLISFYGQEASPAVEGLPEFTEAVLLKKDEAYRMVVGYVHLICPLAANKRVNEFLNIQEYLSCSFIHFELLRHIMNRAAEFDRISGNYINAHLGTPHPEEKILSEAEIPGVKL